METLEKILENLKQNKNVYNIGRTEEEYIVIDLRREL